MYVETSPGEKHPESLPWFGFRDRKLKQGFGLGVSSLFQGLGFRGLGFWV